MRLLPDDTDFDPADEGVMPLSYVQSGEHFLLTPLASRSLVRTASNHLLIDGDPLVRVVPEALPRPLALVEGQEIGPEGLPMHTYVDVAGACATCCRRRGTWPHLNE